MTTRERIAYIRAMANGPAKTLLHYEDILALADVAEAAEEFMAWYSPTEAGEEYKKLYGALAALGGDDGKDRQ